MIILCNIHVQGGGLHGGTILWENLVFEEGGEMSPWRNLGVSAGTGAHAWGQLACLPRAASGEGGIHTLMALLGPAQVLLGWEDSVPPQRSPSAALRRRGAAGAMACSVDCLCSMPHSPPCFWADVWNRGFFGLLRTNASFSGSSIFNC